MKSVPKFISRFIGLLIFSVVLLIVANVIVAAVIIQQQLSDSASYGGSPYTYTQKFSAHFMRNQNAYQIENQYLEELAANNVWGIVIDEETKEVVWQTDHLPQNIPKTYSLAEISNLTLGYVEDYPTYTSALDDGLLILGFPKESYWKMIRPTWSYSFIANAPQILLIVLAVNIILLLLIYLWFSGKIVRSVTPIVQGIKNLSTGQGKSVPEKGVLSEIAENINQTSEILEEQERQLLKKESARADWIAGISHDIRTPLSMVIGYTSQLGNSSSLSPEERKKAKIILNQSQKIKQLVNDLNLSSKLEYSMQPMNLKRVNLTSLIRQVIVDFINNDLDENYSIEWLADEAVDGYFIQADEELMKRAIINLIQNAINHNPDGCTIYVSIKKKNQLISIVVEDNGIGVSESQLKNLNNSSHKMLRQDKNLAPPHGLGLLIVRQIIEAHDGSIVLGVSSYGGFSVAITLPEVSNEQGK